MSDTKSTTASSDNAAVETKDSPKKADTSAKATTTSDKSKKEAKPATAKSQPASKANTATELASKEIAKEEVKAPKSPEQPIEPIEPIIETIPVEQVPTFPVTVTLTRSVGTYRGPSEAFLGKPFGGTVQLSDRTSDGQYYKVNYVRSGVGLVTGYMRCREVDSCRF